MTSTSSDAQVPDSAAGVAAEHSNADEDAADPNGPPHAEAAAPEPVQPESEAPAVDGAGAAQDGADTPRESEASEGAEGERCYPYLPRANGRCRTRCTKIDHCAGSRGPADFAEKGWPLDCINGRCVPLHPDAVVFD